MQKIRKTSIVIWSVISAILSWGVFWLLAFFRRYCLTPNLKADYPEFEFNLGVVVFVVVLIITYINCGNKNYLKILVIILIGNVLICSIASIGSHYTSMYLTYAAFYNTPLIALISYFLIRKAERLYARIHNLKLK